MHRLRRSSRRRGDPRALLVLSVVVGGLLAVPTIVGPTNVGRGPNLPSATVPGLRSFENSNGSEPWAVGVNGSAVTFDPESQTVFVSDPANGTVLVLNGTTRDLAHPSISVAGAGPSVFDTDNGYVYILSAGPGGWGSVTVINGTTDAIVPSRIVVGGDPSALAYDARDNLLFVANYVTNNLSVVNGADQRVQGDSIYLGSTESPATLAFDQRTGILYIGTWDTASPGMDLGGRVRLFDGSNGTLSNASVGSSLEPTSLAYDSADQEIYEAGYQPTPGQPSPIVAINGTTGTTNPLPDAGVNGGSVVVAGFLGLVYIGSDDGPPRVFESASDAFVPAPLAAPGEPAAFDSSSGWLFLLAPGTGPSGPPGPIEAVRDTALVPVSFVETGLPTGARWQVRFAASAIQNSSSTNSVGFFAWNGSYSYEVTPVPGESTAYSGTTLVQGPSTSVRVTFAPFEFPVTFRELGLAAGTSWSGAVVPGPSTGLNWSTPDSNMLVDLPNGSYRIEFAAPGYSTPSGAISVVVNGTSPANQTVVFTRVPASPNPSDRLWEVTMALAAGVLVLGGVLVVRRVRSRRPPTQAPPVP